MLLVYYFDSIAMFLSGAFVTYLGLIWDRLNIGDRMPPARREKLGRKFRIGGPFLMGAAVLLAVLKALLAP